MSVHPFVHPFGVFVAAALTLSPAHAAEPPNPKKPPARVTFYKAPSEESAAQRAERMKRECKGRPNAGACLGFAS